MTRSNVSAIAVISAAAATILGASAASAASCPSIEYAGLQAVGSEHRSGEYVAYLSGTSSKPSSVTLWLRSSDEHWQTPVIVHISPANQSSGPQEASILIVAPHATVANIRVASVQEDKSAERVDCSASSYTVRETKVRTFSFDDTAAWVKQGGATAFQFTGPAHTELMCRDRSCINGMTGVCRLLVAIRDNGSVEDATVLESSGDRDLDDAAVKEALSETFVPAKLPKSMGGAAIGSIADVTMTYSTSMVTIHIH